VSFVKDWDRAVKHAIDAGETRLIMVTGSHAHDLKRGADRMPGRFDGGGEFFLLPMNFAEFKLVRAKAGWSAANRLDELRLYFRIGGFPAAVAEAGPEGHAPQKALDTYWRWLAGDVVRLGKQEAYLIEVLSQLARVSAAPVSYQALARQTRIGSHNTFQEYISVLESCFAVRTLKAIDLDSGAFRFRKNRKFYFTDPLLFALALKLGNQPPAPEMESCLAETVAHEELARRHDRFGYFSGPSGEIDFILPKKWAVEVKWAPVAANLSKAYLQAALPWKTVWTHANLLLEYPPESQR
jgi:predicted AAA+ superfamily ATPase